MKIKSYQIILFILLQGVAVGLTVLTVKLLSGCIPTSDFRGLILFIAGMFFFYMYNIMILRTVHRFLPVPTGDIIDASKGEFAYHLNLLFYLVILLPLLRMPLPIPLLRTIYIALGAQLGKNAYCSGLILDPHFVKVGENTLIGMNALIVPHILENRRAAQYPVIIGNNVTIGAHAIIQAGCTIGDNAIVAMGSVVRKHTTINVGEVWGGVPAKFLKS
jgi:acetyltransferase-like isoleucine patch superfamily enzyme